MTRTRLKVLYYYFSTKNNVTFPELVKFFFDSPYSYKAKRIIKSTVVEDNWIKYHLRGYEDKTLFFPREFSIKSFEQVVVESFYKNNWHFYEIEQTRVKENDIVVDCGAAEGLFSFIIANRCKFVHAIEPLNKFVESLSLTFKDSSNIRIIDKALSDHEHSAFISEQGISSVVSNEKNGIEVNVTTLDKLFFENSTPVSYIKMDLEGYDYLALRGGGKTY